MAGIAFPWHCRLVFFTHPSPISMSATPASEETNIVEFPGMNAPVAITPSGKGSTIMRSDLVEEALKVIPEPPTLINLVSARVKQLNTGRAPLVVTDFRMGAADIALTEIIEGKIGVLAEEDDDN